MIAETHPTQRFARPEPNDETSIGTVKLTGGPADGSRWWRVVLAHKLAVFERSEPPRSHHYVRRLNGRSEPVTTAGGDFIYDFERTL